MELLQQTKDCSDFDVVLAEGSGPAFRILLPEHANADGYQRRMLHMIPGDWRHSPGGSAGMFNVAGELEISVSLTKDESDVRVELKVRNLMDRRLSDVYVNVCGAVNHIPGEPPWCNRTFIPDAPLDRAVQGRLWYERITPGGLFALTAGGWVTMHRQPDAPDADAVELYSFTPSDRPEAYACAVHSPDGAAWFFQAWNSNCYYLAPCPGNACMHLQPMVADTLAPGEQAQIVGLAGIHTAAQDELAEKIMQFRKKTER